MQAFEKLRIRKRLSLRCIGSAKKEKLRKAKGLPEFVFLF
jgi:hypothetical protein